jgi:hypothetical protein
MIKVSANKNNQIFIGQFESQELADAWIAECVASNAWGLPERPELDADDNPTGNILPAEYTIEITDVTEQVEAEKKVSVKLAKQAFGSLFMAQVLVLNDKKLASGELSEADLLAMESDAALMMIEKCAWRGMIDTLKALIAAYAGPFYTQDDKDYLLFLITNAGY